MCGFVRTTAAAILLVSLAYSQPQEAQYCFGGTDWMCLGLGECPWAVNALKHGQKPKMCNSQEPKVCCPRGVDKSNTGSAVTETLSISVSQRRCREYAEAVKDEVCLARSVRVLGGKAAAMAEFPHMASIGYGDYANSISWMYGGSLISDRFVLSAAYCSEYSNKPAQWVWLGIDDDSEDSTKQITLRIKRRHVHPLYNKLTKYNDIALFELEEKVRFSKYIRPICLPDYRPIPTHLIASGWGRTAWDEDTTDALMKVPLEYVDIGRCNATIDEATREFPKGLMADTQMCAGGLGRATCLGDNGGPLQARLKPHSCMYMQFGITSYGPPCGLSNAPSVYTLVSGYVPWIENIVW